MKIMECEGTRPGPFGVPGRVVGEVGGGVEYIDLNEGEGSWPCWAAEAPPPVVDLLLREGWRVVDVCPVRDIVYVVRR